MNRWQCGCFPCRIYRSQHKQQTKVIRAAGGPLRVPAAESVAVIAQWRSHGYTYPSIGAAIGMSREWLSQVASGDSHLIDRRTAAELKALTHQRLIAATEDDGKVPAIGAVRRLQALAVRGWSARALPAEVENVAEMLLAGRRSLITARRHRAVSEVYERLCMAESPSKQARAVSARAKGRGWAPPLAWDENIDDPDAQPWQDTDTGNRVDAAKAAFVEDVDFLFTAGLSVDEVCTRLGVRVDTAEQRLRRAGQRGDTRARELSREFHGARERYRKAPDDAGADIAS